MPILPLYLALPSSRNELGLPVTRANLFPLLCVTDRGDRPVAVMPVVGPLPGGDRNGRAEGGGDVFLSLEEKPAAEDAFDSVRDRLEEGTVRICQAIRAEPPVFVL